MKENPVTHICSEIIDNLPEIKDEESLKRYLEKTPSWATPIAPDFGEPWRESVTWNQVSTKDDSNVLYNASDMEEPYRSRAIDCVNACAGMTDPAAEVTHLKNWKKEMSEVERTWSEQAVGKLLDMPLGINIRQNIYPAVAKLRADLETAENTALRLAEKADAMRVVIEEAFAAIKDATDNCLWRSDSPIPLSEEESQRIYNLAVQTMDNLRPFLP